MRTIAICNPALKKVMPDGLFFEFPIGARIITFGLLDVEDITAEKYLTDSSVLVKVNAFSCSYRDKSMMLLIDEKCRKLSKDQKYFYSPFGSEFIAEVLSTGKKIKNIKVGDRVIPNACYPFNKNERIGGLPTNCASQRVQLFTGDQLVKIPECMPDEVAASFTIASQTAYSIIRKLSLQANVNVLVTSATSNTSLAVINALRHKEINIYAVSSNTQYTDNLIALGVKRVIPLSAMCGNKMRDYIDNLKFDAVIDPFFDLAIDYIIDYIDFNGSYIFCDLYNQYPSFELVEKFDRKMFFLSVFAKCIAGNIRLIGNCLGQKDDLNTAITDYINGKYDIIIDSILTGEDILPFLNKTFRNTSRFGKIIYKYV
jgi:NADPH:quinone reductase-like Zn-dependent oxidoreductase